MNEYSISDYGIFSSAVGDAKSLGTSLATGKSALAACKTQLSDGSIFMGPACDNCLSVLTNADSKLVTNTDNFSALEKFLIETSSNYQSGDQNAASLIGLSTGNSSTFSGSPVLTGSSNQEKIYNYLTSQGLNQAAVCGILANIKQESNFKTGDWGDGGTSYGICQWHNTRFTELQNYCSSNNLDYQSLEGQVSFLTYELQNKYPELYKTLQSVPNNEEGAYIAAYQMTVKFERPADMEWRGEQRGYSAQEMLNSYNQAGTTQV